MLSDLIVTVLKPNKACLISCCFIIINEITTWGQFNRNTARDILARSPRSDNMTLALSARVAAIRAPQIAVVAQLETDLVSSHPLPLVSFSLYLFSLVDFSLFPALPLPVPDNFPQMAHQKRFIERKYRQELKEMRRERERQEKETDEPEDSRKWQHLLFLFFFFFWDGEVGQSGPASTSRSCVWRAWFRWSMAKVW